MEQVKRYKFIDADSQTSEPHNPWASRIWSQKGGDRVPHLWCDPELKKDSWNAGDIGLESAWAPAQSRWPNDVDSAALRSADSVGWMDTYGIRAQVPYANAALGQCLPDNYLYETGFPDPTAMLPGTATVGPSPNVRMQKALGHHPEDVIPKVPHDNAARLCHLDRLPSGELA